MPLGADTHTYQHGSQINFKKPGTHGVPGLTNKTKLMLRKSLFIAHGRVKGFLKVILPYKNKAPQLQKWV